MPRTCNTCDLYKCKRHINAFLLLLCSKYDITKYDNVNCVPLFQIDTINKQLFVSYSFKPIPFAALLTNR